jgi:transposase
LRRGTHHLSRKLKGFGHDARLMPAKYVRPYSKGQKNDFRDAEAIAEAVQRSTMEFVATRSTFKVEGQTLKMHREFISRVTRQSCPPEVEAQIARMSVAAPEALVKA